MLAIGGSPPPFAPGKTAGGAIVVAGSTLALALAAALAPAAGSGKAFSPGASPSSEGKLICAMTTTVNDIRKCIPRLHRKIDGFITNLNPF